MMRTLVRSEREAGSSPISASRSCWPPCRSSVRTPSRHFRRRLLGVCVSPGLGRLLPRVLLVEGVAAAGSDDDRPAALALIMLGGWVA